SVLLPSPTSSSSFFFNDTATTEIYTLSLHDALPICNVAALPAAVPVGAGPRIGVPRRPAVQDGETEQHVIDVCGNRRFPRHGPRSEEHTSELQSLAYLVCRLLLEKKKNNN